MPRKFNLMNGPNSIPEIEYREPEKRRDPLSPREALAVIVFVIVYLALVAWALLYLILWAIEAFLL